MEKLDVLVVGAGVVGLAIARNLALSGRQVVVAEKEKFPGSVTTSRNSGVIHAGIYYPSNSLKARLCVKGRRLLYEYAKQKRIPHKKCGKLIVACEVGEVEKLEAIKQKARANGVNDLELLTAEQVHHKEPEIECYGALLSPSTGIIDVHTLLDELIKDTEGHDGLIAYDNEIEKIEIRKEDFLIQLVSGEAIVADTVINAAGLDSQRIASKIECFDQKTIPKQFLAKGQYFSISGKTPFNHLVYPVPVKGGLGIHFTRNIAGESLFGPDVKWLADGEDINYEVEPERAELFERAIQRYWPSVKERELRPAYSGVRPKIVGPSEADGDFVIHSREHHGVPRLVNLYGIESPGLTSALAIAEYVTETIL